MLKKFVLGGMVVVAALLGNACGDDGSGDSPAGPADSEVSLSSSSEDVIPGNGSSSSVTESPSTSSGQAPQSAESDGSSSSEKAVGGSSSSGGKNSSSSGKVESSSSDEGENSSSSKKVLSSSSAKTEGSSSSVKTEESSSSKILDKSSSSDKPVESSNSETKPVESSSSIESSSSLKLAESSSSVEKGSSSSTNNAEIKPNNYYKTNCPGGIICKYVTTEFLNQEFLASDKYGEVLDERDGQVYKTIEIGSQTWIAQNLNYKKGKSWCYKNESDSCLKYGVLYSWATAIDSLALITNLGQDCGYKKKCTLPSKVQGICPDGWHLPDTTEWSNLFKAAGGKSAAGTNLKSQTGWYAHGNGTDLVGFAALPAGYRTNYDEKYNRITELTRFWNATEGDASYTHYVDFHYNDEQASFGFYLKDSGYSVRCVKDAD